MLMIDQSQFPGPLKRQGYEKNKVQSYAARALIVDTGDEPKHLYRIVEGWAAQCRFLDDGKRQITGLFLPGEHVDPGWILRPLALQAMIALTPLSVERTPLEALRNDASSDKRWSHETLRAMAIQTEWLVNLGKRSAIEKLAHLFCELQLRATNTDESLFDFPLTQIDLADICGMTSVHINRTLQQMRAMLLIELNHRQLEILDREKLERICGFDSTYLVRTARTHDESMAA